MVGWIGVVELVLPSPPQRGSQYTYSDQAIESALTVRCLLNFLLRPTQGFIHSILVLIGLDDVLVVPNYSTCRAVKQVWL